MSMLVFGTVSSLRTYGRRVMHDPRDRKYLYKPKRLNSRRTKRYWTSNGFFYDQGPAPECVGAGWGHWLYNDPVCQWLPPSGIYKIAQQFDEWAGDSYEGTSVRAGAKVLQMLGFIEKYEWATNLDTLLLTLLEKGPVVVGTNWYEGMARPQGPNNALMTATGKVLGGHCYLIDGVNLNIELLRIKNSYGTDWANNGRADISFKDFDRLIKEEGEICIASEKKPTPK